MKLAIVGGRDFQDYDLMLCHIPGHVVESIVSGGAKGADSLAKKIAERYSLEYIEFLPDWALHGKSAGFKRNVQIVEYCDKLIAFWDGKSKGTKHSIDLAKKSGKLYKVVSY